LNVRCEAFRNYRDTQLCCVLVRRHASLLAQGSTGAFKRHVALKWEYRRCWYSDCTSDHDITAGLCRNGQSSCIPAPQARSNQRAAVELLTGSRVLAHIPATDFICCSTCFRRRWKWKASEQHASQGCIVRRTMKEYTSYT
jgi:hypothetical protein